MAKFANAPRPIGMSAERQRVSIRAVASREGFLQWWNKCLEVEFWNSREGRAREVALLPLFSGATYLGGTGK